MMFKLEGFAGHVAVANSQQFHPLPECGQL